MTHIFISYSRRDTDYVEQLERRLASEGFQVWRDNHIRTGDAWWQVVKANIESCSAIVVVMSPAAAESLWVMRETAIADYLGKRAFPLLLDGSATDDAWSIYSFVHHTDVQDGRLPDATFYDHLARFSPRRKLAGGVRVDGVYVCERSHVIFNEALRFFTNQTVASFMMRPETDIEAALGNDGDQFSYDVESDTDEIVVTLHSGRTMIGKFKQGELHVRVEYPNLPPDYRAYTFKPFDDR
ncbi:MAG: toll/interleukin-1 receptor domain-containing protein [Chloroflexota bacterium]